MEIIFFQHVEYIILLSPAFYFFCWEFNFQSYCCFFNFFFYPSDYFYIFSLPKAFSCITVKYMAIVFFALFSFCDFFSWIFELFEYGVIPYISFATFPVIIYSRISCVFFFFLSPRLLLRYLSHFSPYAVSVKIFIFYPIVSLCFILDIFFSYFSFNSHFLVLFNL